LSKTPDFFARIPGGGGQIAPWRAVHPRGYKRSQSDHAKRFLSAVGRRQVQIADHLKANLNSDNAMEELPATSFAELEAGRDSRAEFNTPTFKDGVKYDIEVGMELEESSPTSLTLAHSSMLGYQDGLVHVSQLADPSSVIPNKSYVKVGQVGNVRVLQK
jgi:transcriptional accessory protein Tex/SPT6